MTILLTRRGFVAALPALAIPVGRAATDDALSLLHRGGAVVLLRHAATEAGFGDPPGFRLDDCRTQRNLSAEGRAQATRIGEWFRRQGLRPAAVRSSRWCRCVDTATLAFGRAEPWDALNSFFDDRTAGPGQTRQLHAALAALPAGRLEAWVTHQVNITALTGEPAAVGEGFVVAAGREAGADDARPPRRVLRLRFEG